MYTNLGVITKGTVLEVNIGDIGRRLASKCRSRLLLPLPFLSTSLFQHLPQTSFQPPHPSRPPLRLHLATGWRPSPPSASGGGTPSRSLFPASATSSSHPVTGLTATGQLSLRSSTAMATISWCVIPPLHITLSQLHLGQGEASA